MQISEERVFRRANGMCKGPGVGVFSLEPSEGRTVREEAREVTARSRDWVRPQQGLQLYSGAEGSPGGVGPDERVTGCYVGDQGRKEGDQ